MTRTAICLLIVALLAGCLNRPENHAAPPLIEYSAAQQEVIASEMLEHCMGGIEVPMLCSLVVDYGKTRRALCAVGENRTTPVCLNMLRGQDETK